MKHTTKTTDVGKNRTGIATSPVDAQKTIDGAREGVRQASFMTTAIEQLRVQMSREAEPMGTMPPPATPKGMATTIIEALKGEKATVLLDLIGERLAFERTGTRLYEALLAKHGAADIRPGGPTREELEAIRDEELGHASMLAEAMTRLGGDPTAITPCANVTAVASMGLVQVLTDPRTTLTEGLKTILIAELTDTDSWEMLADMAQKMGQEDLEAQFREAADAEAVHLAKVRTWVESALRGQAGVEEDASEPAATPSPLTPGG